MKKIIKNSLLNRLFKTKEVNANSIDFHVQQHIVGCADQYLYSIGNCNSLIDMMHKKLWNDGFQNENTKPCSYGFFRTKDIATMKTDEVYLGNIFGLIIFHFGKTIDMKLWQVIVLVWQMILCVIVLFCPNTEHVLAML